MKGVGLIACLMSAPAQAHLATTGFGPVYDGVAHVFLTPQDLLAVLVVGLLAGLCGPAAARLALLLLSGSWLAGGLAGFLYWQPFLPDRMTLATLLLLGALAVAGRRLPVWLIGALAAAAGVLHGWFNGAAIAAVYGEPVTLLGITATVFVLVALLAALVISLHSSRSRIAVRVAGSGIFATGLVMLGWQLQQLAF